MAKKLKNDSKRKFQFGSDFKTMREFKPGEVAIFDDDTAATLLKNAGVIDVDNYTVAFDQTKVSDFSEGEKPKKKSKAAPSDENLAAALKS